VFREMSLIQLFPLGALLTQMALCPAFAVSSYYAAATWRDEDPAVYGGVLGAYAIGFIWSVQVVRGATWTALSVAIAQWHERRATRGTGCIATGVPLLSSALVTVLFKHLGSVCFCAAVIAAVQIVQLGLRALRALINTRADAPNLLKLIVKCALCCIGCLDRTVRVVSHYALVYVAMRGHSFCRAANATFSLVVQHPLQVAVNRVVQRLLALLVGLTTPLACALAAYAHLDAQSGYAAQHNPGYCAAVVFATAYLVTDSLVLCFNCGIDTLWVLSVTPEGARWRTTLPMPTPR
jgi:choline transporter-like protein 2/4/5